MVGGARPGKCAAMARTSDKHSARRDEQLAHEEHGLVHGAPDEGRTEPRRSEAPGPGEGGVGARPEAEEAAHGATPVSEIEGRAALAATFSPTVFPARPDRLVEEAKAHFADSSIVAALERLPDRVYETVGDVWDAIHGE
jgi:hypothetical protein